MPLFLKGRYDFYEGDLGQGKTLFILDRGLDDITPSTVAKHMQVVEKKSGSAVIYICESITAYNRKRLIKKKIPFVVSDNQMCLAPLRLDLREYHKAASKKSASLSPSSQAFLLYFLLNEDVPSCFLAISANFFISKLGYSYPTINRALKEIIGLELKIFNCSEDCPIKRADMPDTNKMELWDEIHPYIKNPVKRRFFAHVDSNAGIFSGLTALARKSMIYEPQNNVIAMILDEWKSLLSKSNTLPVDAREEGTCEIEIWSYKPWLFECENTVDILSLYMSLKDNDDERVQMVVGLQKFGEYFKEQCTAYSDWHEVASLSGLFLLLRLQKDTSSPP